MAKLSLAGVEALLLANPDDEGLICCGAGKGLDLPDIGGVGLKVGYDGPWLKDGAFALSGLEEVQLRPDRSSIASISTQERRPYLPIVCPSNRMVGIR